MSPKRKNISANKNTPQLFYPIDKRYGKIIGHDVDGLPVFENYIMANNSKAPPFNDDIIKQEPKSTFKPLYLKSNYQQRQYQLKAAEQILGDNFSGKMQSTAIIFPPGTGKTFTSALIIDKLLDKNKPILITAPTVALCIQHEKELRSMFNLKKEDILSVAATYANTRKKIYSKSMPKILISTPQTIVNDLQRNKLNWDFSAIIYDESDFAIGDYDYVNIAKYAKEHNTLSIALTGTPGNAQKTYEMVKNLNLENMIIKVDFDPDIKAVQRGVEEIDIPINIENHRLEKFIKHIEKLISTRERILASNGYQFRSNKYYLNILDLEKSIGKVYEDKKIISLELKKGVNSIGTGYYYTPEGMQLRDKLDNQNNNIRYASQLYHLLELRSRLITESFASARIYLDEKLQKKEKSNKNWDGDPLLVLVNELKSTGFYQALHKIEEEHPKIYKIHELLSKIRDENKDLPKEERRDKTIITVSSRAQAKFLVNYLKSSGFDVRIFMGKADTSFTQKEQNEALRAYIYNEFNILVATEKSISRGIDLPRADNLIRTTQSASGVDYVQIKNRVNRGKLYGKEKGRYYNLYTENNMEQRVLPISKRKAQSNVEFILDVKDMLDSKLGTPNPKTKKPTTLMDVLSLFVYADFDKIEKSKPVATQLSLFD